MENMHAPIRCSGSCGVRYIWAPSHTAMSRSPGGKGGLITRTPRHREQGSVASSGAQLQSSVAK